MSLLLGRAILRIGSVFLFIINIVIIIIIINIVIIIIIIILKECLRLY